MNLLDNDVEDWIEATIDEIMEKYEKAGTPIRGGFTIAEALRAAYLMGQKATDDSISA